MEDDLPDPEPSGALVPPPTYPPTALATAALPPRRRDDDEIELAASLLRRAVRSALDTLDAVGDSIATAVGLR